MTESQKAAIEEAAIKYGRRGKIVNECYPFMDGAREVVNNPEKYRLMPVKPDFDTERKTIVQILIENEVLRFNDIDEPFNLCTTRDGYVHTVKAIVKSMEAYAEPIRDQTKELEDRYNRLNASYIELVEQSEQLKEWYQSIVEESVSLKNQIAELTQPQPEEPEDDLIGAVADYRTQSHRIQELEAENARYRDRIGEALKFLQSRQQTTPGLGAPVTILKQALEK